jgi:hypothetical protein
MIVTLEHGKAIRIHVYMPTEKSEILSYCNEFSGNPETIEITGLNMIV